jgi:hypothetical protein
VKDVCYQDLEFRVQGSVQRAAANLQKAATTRNYFPAQGGNRRCLDLRLDEWPCPSRTSERQGKGACVKGGGKERRCAKERASPPQA